MTKRLVLAVLLLAATVPLLTGCPKRHQTFKPTKTEADGEPLPNEVQSRRMFVRWQERSPKGTLQPLLEVRAAKGVVDARTQSGTLNQASGMFYKDGKLAATFAAPRVDAIRGNGTVVASGTVVVRSVSPPGVTVRAARVTWTADLSRITAEGDVEFEQRKPGVARPIAWGGKFSRVTADTELQKITIP